LITSGCGGDDGKRVIRAGKYGMMSSETPQYAAIVFMLTIYENSTLDETLTLTNKKFGARLKAYHTNKSVQRHILNLRLNDVEVEPVSGGFTPRTEFSKSASVDVIVFSIYSTV